MRHPEYKQKEERRQTCIIMASQIELISQEIKNIKVNIQEQREDLINHADREEKHIQNIYKKMGECPESSHIIAQNGKLDTLTFRVGKLQGSIALWGAVLSAVVGVVGLVFSILKVF